MKLILYMVMSIDGVVALDEITDISDYSSKEDHDFFLRGVSSCDAAIMGRFSYNSEIKCGTKYLLPHTLKQSDVTDETVILLGNADEIYRKIKADGHQRIALLGGPRTNHQFLSKGSVDEIFLTVEPVIIGQGIRLADNPISNQWALQQTIRLNSNGTVVLHYVKKNAALTNDHNRWQRILHNNLFNSILKELEITERERVFCKHGLVHLLDTARIMYIINLEEGLCISKDIIYAAGLLHDIGRLSQYKDGIPHDKAGIPIAKEIMQSCGYTEEEQELILFAISSHRKEAEAKAEPFPKKTLADILYKADKRSRACFSCEAADKCNWPDAKKNKTMMY